MKKDLDLICWDTPVLIDWLQESRTKNRMRSIKSVMSEIKARKYKLAGSTLAYVESWNAKCRNKQ